jgi:hypothetical protein
MRTPIRLNMALAGHPACVVASLSDSSVRLITDIINCGIYGEPPTATMSSGEPSASSTSAKA